MSQSDPQPQTTDTVDRAPPAEEFWERYSPRHELPISTVASIAVHTLVIGLLVLYLLGQFGDRTKPAIEIAMEPPGNNGDGADPGPDREPGGRQDLIERPDVRDRLPQAIPPLELPAVTERLGRILPQFSEDPDLEKMIEFSEGAAQIAKLKQELGKALADGLARKPGGGAGDKGTGHGGDPGQARQLLRWTIRFETVGADPRALGDDYLRQLAGLGAWVGVPITDNPRQVTLYKNPLARPARGEAVDATEVGRMFFVDTRRDSIEGVALALGLAEVPGQMIAFFPEEREQELQALEKQRAGPRKLSDVKQTYFRATLVGGKYRFRVEDQTYFKR